MIVLIISSILFSYSPHRTFAAGATLYLSPTSGSFISESTFDISILVNTGDQAINAVSVDLEFPPDKLQIVRSEPSSSVISVWIAQPTFSNKDGRISLTGGLPTPGVNSSAANIITIQFRAKNAGVAKIHFSSNSKVLANDGNGTNILSSTNDSTFNITAKPQAGPTISSPTHPDQNSWYNNNSPSFNWDGGTGVEAISYEFDRNPSTEPDTTAETFVTATSMKTQDDGTWYFHLRIKAEGVWSGTGHYKTQIDTTPPAKFSPVVDPSRAKVSERVITTFQTTDALSGINYYEIKVESMEGQAGESGLFTEQQSPYVLPTLIEGEYRVIVRAFDKAGNITEGSADVRVSNLSGLLKRSDKSLLYFILASVGVLALIVIVIYIIRRRRRKWHEALTHQI